MTKTIYTRIFAALLSLALAATLSVTASAASLDNFSNVCDYTAGQFTDVPADSWCAENVRVAYECGLMNGKSATLFDPDGSLTVAQTIVLACRVHSIYHGNDIAFESASPWYRPYAEYAIKNGIISDEDVDYDAAIDRASFAVILGRALPDSALPVVSSVEDGAIPDVDESANYAAAVYRLYRAGILTGNDAKGTFAPDSGITRGAAAAIVGRMADPSLRKKNRAQAACVLPCPHRPAFQQGEPAKEMHRRGVPGGLRRGR